jgi:hypothetical protein
VTTENSDDPEKKKRKNGEKTRNYGYAGFYLLPHLFRLLRLSVRTKQNYRVQLADQVDHLPHRSARLYSTRLHSLPKPLQPAGSRQRKKTDKFIRLKKRKRNNSPGETPSRKENKQNAERERETKCGAERE